MHVTCDKERLAAEWRGFCRYHTCSLRCIPVNLIFLPSILSVSVISYARNCFIVVFQFVNKHECGKNWIIVNNNQRSFRLKK